MKHRDSKDEEKVYKINGSTSSMGNNRKKKKNMQRLGGTGLSLEAFANAKSMSNKYNPAFKKKQREFYKNAKYVSKYKQSLKQQSQQIDAFSAVRPIEQDQNRTRDVDEKNIKNKNKKKPSMEELYKKKREEEEQARIEREASIQAKKVGREKAEAERKATRAKMFKKTKYGQPVMKYRIEHLLQTIQSSSRISVNNSN
ncbi:rRNA-processing protein FYV7 isoform X1 [Pistacia vera]|uniref:rRNA-processing protein FYV7 isoform X1 n=1 Tax=Pistacia vera TaxID=55513 RepID=UPI001263527B|nr:rRNA-processing protein FYV7 isoform X1 [Pistacia vera]